jgi:primosomal protein N' (replication factor Y) (superfamily II helicase)
VSTRTRRERTPAAQLPVARVAVDIPLAHLDRPFDYQVPEELAGAARPGCRVRVRFAGQLVDGFVLDRLINSEHPGRLAYLERVVSSEPVLHADVIALARAIADRYAGTLADVLRLAVPPRHARAEAGGGPAGDRAASPAVGSGQPPAGATTMPAGPGWTDYPTGTAFLTALSDGRSPRAVWSALPRDDWAVRLAEAAQATLRGGRGAVMVVPDARDLDRLDAACAQILGAGRHVALHAALGPQQRYLRFLAASRGEVAVVIGTRAAAFAPVDKLGLVALWDDGDDLHAEPRAPYPHAREVLLTRAQLAGAGVLLAGYARTAEAQQLIESGWATEMIGARITIRARSAQVAPTGDDADRARDPAAASARLPSLAWRAARDAIGAGAPVLVQVPRRGYLPAVSCVECRHPARCPRCSGPLELRSSHAVAGCRWCGRPAADYACPNCGGRRLRGALIGAGRTAEELGRAFPGTPVRTSGRDGVLDRVPHQPALVVATPGAEPIADDGYGAVLLLDTWALLTRADLRAGEEALRRWLNAAALARPASAGGRVVIVADGGLAPVQALLRFDPATFATRELAERRMLGFPPAARFGSLTGSAAAIADLLAAAQLPDGTDQLGPVSLGESQERLLLRVGRSGARALAAALHAAAGVRSARKAGDSVRIQIDPLELW